MKDEGMTIVLHKRPLNVSANIVWGISSIGMTLIVGQRLLLGSPLGRSVAGTWSTWIILASIVAGVAAIMYRKLRSTGLFLSNQGISVKALEGRRVLPWKELTAIAAANKITSRGIVQAVELRFGREPPICLVDEFTIRHNELVRLIREYASAAGAASTFTATNTPVETAHDIRAALLLIGVFLLPILLVAGALIGFTLHTRHLL